MKRKYESPVVEKITFDYKVQTKSSDEDCYESVMNVREDGTSGTGMSSACIGGTPIVIGWTEPQTGV